MLKHTDVTFFVGVKVVVSACYGAYFVVHILNIWRQIFYPENLYDAAFWNFHIIDFENSYCQRGLQAPAPLGIISILLINYRACLSGLFG